MRNERRRSPRIKPDGLIYLKLGSENGGIILDLCERGLSFRMVAPVELDQPLSFSLALAPAERFRATGELAWTDQTRKTGGLQFTSLPSNARGLLQNWLDQHALPESKITEAAVAPPITEALVEESLPEPISPPTRAKFKPSPREQVANAFPAAPAAESRQSPQADSRAPDAKRIDPQALHSAAAHHAMASFQLARAAPAKFKGFLSSAFASEDVQNAPEHLLIAAVDFTLLAASACIGFLRTLATPGVVREAAKVAFVIGCIMLLVSVVLSFHGDLGNSLIRLGRDIAGEQPAVPIAPSSSPNPSSSTPESPASEPSRTGKRVERPARTGAVRPSLRVPGDSQLEIARRYLRGANGTSQPERAVPWLWAASHEGNAAADILLADLYIRGEGVAQNCQQGIVLLTAAAKKGDSVAASKLRDLDSGPCGSAAKPK